MNKIRCVLSMLMVLVVMPLMSMEKENIIQIMGDVSVISLKESNLALMKTLHKHTQLHQKNSKQCGLVPRYPHVSPDEIHLVDQALSVRPDKFQDYYNNLSQQNRLLLIKASGQYNEVGKKVMLDAPEVTKRLIEVCFTDDGLRNLVKSYLKNEDEDVVRSYFKEQLICSKRLLGLKQRYVLTLPTRYRLIKDVYLGSVFLNAFNTVHQYDYPISLYTGDKVRKTYATYFGIDNYEYRITDVCGDKCLLWVVNHNNPDATFSTVIKHKENIKGCCLSSTKTDVEGVLTYSDYDMVFSMITTINGEVFVDSVAVENPYHIVDVCFEPINNRWIVGMYEDLEYVFKRWSMQGEYIESRVSRSFKKHGLLDKIAICDTDEGYRWAEIMGVANLYSVIVSDIATDNGVYRCPQCTSLQSPFEDGNTDDYGRYFLIFKVADVINMLNLRYPVLKENSEAHKVYSPQGTFLMSNSLKWKFGMLYVETVIQDAMTHKQILSIDTLYKGFEGVGFSHDETELFFFDSLQPSKVSLLSDTDKQVLAAIEDKACTNLGVASLVKRLCMECRDNGYILLDKKDSTYTMLCDWFKSSNVLKALEQLLPMRTIKK